MIDLKKRLKNKAFLTSLTSAGCIAVQAVLAPLGIQIDNDYIMTATNAVLGVLVLMGIVIDPTTPGIGD